MRSKLLLAFLLLGPIGVLPSAEPVPTVESDTVLALKAKAALAADPQTAGLNLFVSIKDRVAVVGGPVPDAELSAKVETILRKVSGLAEVKVSCWVPTAEDPLKVLVGEKLKTVAPPAVEPKREPSPVVTPLPRTEPAAPQVTVQRVSAAQALTGFLLDPVGPGGSVLTALPMPVPAYPTIPPPAVPVVPVSHPQPQSPVPALEALRAADPRFAKLVVEVKSGTATITGTARTDRTAWEFAAAVRKVPGIDRVIVGRVDIR